MATQIIDMDDVTSVHFNNYVNDEVQEVRLNGTTIWAKPQGEPMYVEMIWNAPLISPKTFYLATQGGVKHWNGTIEYSADTVNWYTWDPTGVNGQQYATSNAQGHLYLRGSNNSHLCTSGTSSTNGAWWFPYMADGKVEIKGNIETILDYQTVAQGNHPTMDNYCYKSLFVRNTYIGDASKLEMPATTIPQYAYYYMFAECSNLTDAPTILPALSGNNYAYSSMFENCTSLITPPKIALTSFSGTRCCLNMFYGCSSMSKIPAFYGTSYGGTDVCKYMFFGCSNIKISDTQTGEYQNLWRMPISGTAIDPGLFTGGFSYMFQNTGGTQTSNPRVNTNYYTSNEVLTID